MNVFTYGSLMFERVWTRVVHGRHARLPARLADHRRHAVRDRSYPGLVPAPGSHVDGVVWLEVGPRDLERLDMFEGPEYERAVVLVAPLASDAATDFGLANPGGERVPVPAQVYLWKDPRWLLDAEWDPAHFERERIDEFLAAFTPRGDRPGR